VAASAPIGEILCGGGRGGFPAGAEGPGKSRWGQFTEEVFSAKNPLVLPVPKRVVYWPDIGQPVNKNPTLDGINLYRHRDDATGNPIDLIDAVTDPEPTFSISAGDHLYVDPDYLQSGAVESYILQVRTPTLG
jgi:hypothetical protein